MITRRTALVVVTGLASAWASLGPSLRSAAAEPTITEYQFLPRFSVLNEQGGIYPRDIDYRVRGTFDFVTETPPTFIWGRRASFDDVKAWGSHPILAYVLNLDRVLNLTGLEGREVPTGGPFDVYQFRGVTQDGSAVRLAATQIGPWLRMHAETTPPAGSADMLSYHLRAVARRTPVADLNDDGVVDAADLAQWSGKAPRGGLDFLEWQRQLGETPPSFDAVDATLRAALANSAASLASVPEPHSLALLCGAALALARVRRRAR